MHLTPLPPADDLDRAEPHDHAAEQAILGTALVAPESTLAAVQGLTPADFYQPAHATLWAAITGLVDANRQVDPITVAHHLDQQRDDTTRRSLLDMIGGTSYLADLVAEARTGVPADAQVWADIVREHSARRHLLATARRLTQAARSGDIHAATERAHLDLEALPVPSAAPDHTRERYPQLDIADLLSNAQPERDWVVNGLIPAGTSISLVAGAGTGKSLLALGLAIDVALGRARFAGLRIPKRRRVLYVDLENTRDDLRERFESYAVTAGHDLSWFHYLSFPEVPPLDTRNGGRELEAILDAYRIEEHDLVILDSLQRVTQGPENDSDTLRAFYLYTGIMLKRRGLTVLRLDNTGKDQDRGARGTSGKRDDVDLELILLADADNPDRLTIKLNKSRLADMTPIVLTRLEDENGRLRYSSEDDPHQARLMEIGSALDRLAAKPEIGQGAAYDLLRSAGYQYKRSLVRQAVKMRQESHAGTDSCYAEGLGIAKSEAYADDAGMAETETLIDNAEQACQGGRHSSAYQAGAAMPLRPLLSNGSAAAQGDFEATCEACGEPMRDLGDGRNAHPTCELEDEE